MNCENHLFLSARSDVGSVLPKSPIHLSFHANWRGWGRKMSPVLFSLYVNDIHLHSRQVEMASYADKMAILATSRQPALVDNFLASYFRDLSGGWENGGSVSASRKAPRCFSLRPVSASRHPDRFFFSGSKSTGSKSPFLWENLDTRLTWSTRVNQVRKKAAQRMGVLALLLNRSSGISIRTGVLLYKQLIRPMMDYTCSMWTSAARTHVRKLQVLQSKCLRIATSAPWHTGIRKIYKDLGVPFLAIHIRSPTERFDSNGAEVGNPLFRQLSRYLRWPCSYPVLLKRPKGDRDQ
jgi:hypothetical protein